MNQDLDRCNCSDCLALYRAREQRLKAIRERDAQPEGEQKLLCGCVLQWNKNHISWEQNKGLACGKHKNGVKQK